MRKLCLNRLTSKHISKQSSNKLTLKFIIHYFWIFFPLNLPSSLLLHVLCNITSRSYICQKLLSCQIIMNMLKNMKYYISKKYFILSIEKKTTSTLRIFRSLERNFTKKNCNVHFEPLRQMRNEIATIGIPS